MISIIYNEVIYSSLPLKLNSTHPTYRLMQTDYCNDSITTKHRCYVIQYASIYNDNWSMSGSVNIRSYEEYCKMSGRTNYDMTITEHVKWISECNGGSTFKRDTVYHNKYPYKKVEYTIK